MPDEYWERVNKRWTESINDAKAEAIDNSARLRRVLIPVPMLYVPVAVTGVRGAGKSVIESAIEGHVGSKYFQTEHTDHIDARRVKTSYDGKRRRSHFHVIPGQLEQATRKYAFSPEMREQALQGMFSRAAKPMGVIHVVSWGYDWIWEKNRRHAVSRELLAREGQLDLEKLREKSLDREFEHFSEVCGLLKGAWAQKPPGVWLIIAVTKCDLYWPGIDKAKDYYVPDSDSDKSSRFRGRLSRLVKSLHQGGLSQLAVLPVSCAETPFDFSEATDDFDFPTEIYTPPSSELKQAQRQALVNRLQTTIGEFNARR